MFMVSLLLCVCDNSDIANTIYSITLFLHLRGHADGFVLGGLLIMYHYPFLFRYGLFVLYSFWLPQIVTNVARISKTSVHPVYVIVMTVSRMILPCYFLLCPSNFISVENDPTLCLYLGVWVTFQASILILQHVYGPRWFIPRLFEAKKYNYYRSIPQELMSEEELTCVICMHPITVPERSNAIEMMEDGELNHRSSHISGNVSGGGSGNVSISVSEGDEPVVTKCSHVFHEACLRRWMSYSTICPTCRAPLDDGL